ncbi:MAG TPA: PqqD family peptide modification chaperone [Burkholderiaceae bacterium]|nr:PqqD family peptide modification chaperone [Burkholderiaceae bacterium]
MTHESFHADDWYRIAPLMPRLAPHVRVVRQQSRGERWTLLIDEGTGRSHRINEAAWSIVGRCDGRHAVQAIWEATVAEDGADAPTQGEVLRLLLRLSDQGLLRTDVAPEAQTVVRQRDRQRVQRTLAAFNPFAIRLTLFDPDAFLARTQRFVRPVFTRQMGVLWCLLVLAALSAVTFSNESLLASAHLLETPRGWLIVAICFPLMKVVHELGHAYAIRQAGGEVHSVGVTWLLVVPVPYVDGTAAAALRRRRDRLLVSAIGIMVELAFAAVGALVWAAAQPGLVREVAFAVTFIGTVSSFLFNGNPLMRFDGYYLLIDALDLPNLAARSQALLVAALRRYVLRMRSIPLPQTAPGEGAWLWVYGVASVVYRVVLSVSIVLWISGWSGLLAIGIAVYAIFVFVLRPLSRGMRWLAQTRLAPGERWRGALAAMGVLLVGAVALFIVPAPRTVVAEAVVWLPEDAQVRAESDGVVLALHVADGERVEPGTPLLTLDNPDLEVERASAVARLAGLEAEYHQAMNDDRAKAFGLVERMDAIRAEIARAEERLAQLVPTARTAGRLVVPHAADLEGSPIAQGAPLAFVLGAPRTTLRAVVSDADATALRSASPMVHAWINGLEHRRVMGRLVRQTPAAVRELPSAALGHQGGGSVPTDPADPHGRTAREPVFVADVEIDGLAPTTIGGRAWVRFALPAEPLGVQWSRAFAQTFLRQVAPTTL